MNRLGEGIPPTKSCVNRVIKKTNGVVNNILTYADKSYYVVANTSRELLPKINSKYVYVVSSAPKRWDDLGM